MVSKQIHCLPPDLDQAVPSANSALSSPPPHSTNPSGLCDSSLLSAPLQSPFPSPGVSSRSTAGSSGPPSSPGNRSVAPNPSSTLPVLPKYRVGLDSSTTSPEDKKAESSVYYTTAWGSPYAARSPRTWSISQDAGVDRESGDSSPVSVQFGLEPNRPALRHIVPSEDSEQEPGDENLDRSQERDQARNRGKSIQDFTQDWINQYLSGQPRTERSNWLSDDSGSEAPSFITAANHFADDASDDWLGLEQDSRDQDLLKTPTLADFISRRSAANRRGGPIRRVKESLHKRADTLRQEDFWGFAYDEEPRSVAMADAKETQPSMEMEHKALPPDEKPLPPPPVNEKELPPTIDNSQDSAKAVNTERPVENTPPKRQRKKIAWRGKGCFIELPPYDIRGTPESGYRLLTPEDVKRGLEQWEELGYDVQGFNVGAPEDPYNLELGGASRPPYPDTVDLQDEVKPGNCTVSFPNKALWDEYVNNLQEEKLRALGVFGGEDEVQPSPSPASAFNPAMTPFPGLVSSPPIPTGSAASNHLSMHHPFSPQLTQAGNMSNGIASLASPASQFNAQTPFYGVDQGILPGFLPFQPTPPVQGSLTPQSFINLRQSGPDSTIPGALSSLTSMLSPVSPMNDQNAFHQGFGDQMGQGKDGFDDHDYHHEQDGFAEDQLRPLRTPPPNADNFHASTVEIAQPTPRGHSRGHNLSETLQKGVDQVAADYHLENSFERDLDEGDYDPIQPNPSNPGLLHSRWALPESNTPQHMAQHLDHLYGDAYAGEHGHEGSDIDTNPSLTGTPHRNHSLTHNPWHEARPSNGSYAGGHRSKLSTSSLNVEAKEFAPTGHTAAQPLPFSPQHPLQFQTLDHSVFTFGARPGDQHHGQLNVAAPTFTPGNFGASFGADQDKSREFQFSAPSAPSLNVAAPEFSPGRTKIFGDIDLSEIANSAKKSKAIPIVRPDEQKEEEKEAKDDRGRPVPTDRHKRARRGGDGSDGEARFSISHPLGEANNFQAQQAPASHVPAEGKENALPGQDGDLPFDKKASQTQNEAPIERKDTPVSEASTWAPSTKAEDATASRDTAEPKDIQHKGVEAAVENKLKPEEKSAEQKEQDEPTDERGPVQFGQKKPFSAAARTFNFKPSIAEFVPFNAEPPAPPPKDTPPKESKGLMASRYAVASPPSSPPARQLSTELSASADGKEGQATEDISAEAGEEQAYIDEDQDSLDGDQLNAVMDQLNDDSDVGIERISTPKPAADLPEPVVAPSKEKRHVQADNRSEPPSPSPGRGAVSHTLNVPKLDFDAQSQFSATPTKGVASGIHSPVRQLLSHNEHISDWDDMICSGEEVKLANRGGFFDRRINDLLGLAIDKRLNPLKSALSSIQESLLALNSAPVKNTLTLRSASAEGIDSDADDEDDEPQEEDASYRTRSPLYQKDRKLERLRNVVLEALAARDLQPAPEQPPAAELIQLQNSVAELHKLTAQQQSQDTTSRLRDMIQEVVAAQINQRSRSDAEEIGADSLMLQINSLKDMLRGADERTENEYKKRRQAQDTIAQLQRLLNDAKEDAARHSTAAESAEARLLQFQEEKMPYYESFQSKAATLEKERESTMVTLEELSSKNIVLQGTLDEYRFATDSARRETEEANARLEEARAENHHLRNTVANMKMRLEDGLNIRQNLSEKMDSLQDQMATLSGDFVRDQASWRRKEEELNARYNELRASHNRETKLREQLEKDVSKLEEQEREAAKLKFIFGQSQQENERLEELVSDLRQKNQDLDLKAARFEREFNEARESSRVEIQRTRTSLEADLDASNTQVNIVRAELEAQINRLQNQLDNVRLDSDTARERYGMLLEEAHETKASAVADAIASKELSMDEQRKLHERLLNDLRERHARALHNSSEDRLRTENHHIERLEFAEDKVKHLQERVVHLEEKLEIAQSAARAAAEAAQSAKSGGPVAASHSSSPSMQFSQPSSVPEKISPQALRESILVLQDQLQQRETRIDELEHELSTVDKEAPAKIKERVTEITWLRELLGVRLDDLQDIIDTLQQPSFNKHSVRDAAIRLKANLQMQQQEKERAMNGQGFPSLPSLSELTASPRALPLAAAAAWGNWRKGRDNSNSNETPSKSSPASAFLSGLLTPPSSNARPAGPDNSASAAPAWRRPLESRPLRSVDTTPRPLSSRAAGKMREPPTTPPLLRKSSYDHDAEPTEYEPSSLEEDESTADGFVSASPKEMTDGPFGPQISS
ncbi:putative myosin class II heavy chain (MHC) [Aspergillus undulatus]|uniref:putative myosin class II heavy chain (MHC) n=1 Tax=Aspergillus undulatus TaxID=1810928 RepID=UPI003CCCD27F